jgi:hypothetical protein
MGQVVQVNGDYEIKALSNPTTPGVYGKITLNTGDGVGEVRVTGNLVVDGETLTVSATNLQVNDNIITLNFPEAEGAAGVTLTYSGIEVERGTLPRASFIFDETDDSWTIAMGTEGNYNFVDELDNILSKLKVVQILTDPGTDNGDLTLISSGIGVVKVTGTLNYEQQVTEDDDIPNKKYVDDAIQNSPTFQIRSDDTRVVIRDVQTTPNDAETGGSLAFWADITDQSLIGVTESAVGLLVDGEVSAEFYRNRVELFGLTIFSENSSVPGFGIPDTVVIQAYNSSSNIKIETTDTGVVEFTNPVQMNNITVDDPDYVSGSTTIYAKNPGGGGTGLYFVKSDNAPGEFISKSKALVFSMIF